VPNASTSRVEIHTMLSSKLLNHAVLGKVFGGPVLDIMVERENGLRGVVYPSCAY